MSVADCQSRAYKQVVSFSASCVYLTLSASFAAFSLKVQHCKRPIELADYWPPNSPQLNVIDYTIWGAGCEWFEAAFDWCMNWSGTERYWRRHWSVAQTSPCLHSSHRRTVLIFTARQISKNVINCNKLS